MSSGTSGFSDLSACLAALRERGASDVIVKLLAPNQDNDKNQIYLGRGIPTSQLFPGKLSFRGLSGSAKSREDGPRSPIVSLALDFTWVWPDGNDAKAPAAKIIEYSQYPESRLSGFLAGCARAPRALRRTEQDLFGVRLLVLGIAETAIYGAVITEVESPAVATDYSHLNPWQHLPIFRVLVAEEHDDRNIVDLIAEIDRISGPLFRPIVLRALDGIPDAIPATSQAAGWTLEALLNVPRNSISAPDKYGYELKSVGGSKVSLITTEPDFGVRHDLGMAKYLDRFGRQGTSNPRQRVFSGVHQSWEINAATGCQLEITHWDRVLESPDGSGEPSIVLRHVDTNSIVSGWTFAKIGASWMKKHAGAVYVETLKHSDEEGVGYSFGPRVIVAEGTTALLFLRGVSRGIIRLDPGDRFDPEKGFKKRTQWRVQGSIESLLPKRLSELYFSVRVETLGVSSP